MINKFSEINFDRGTRQFSVNQYISSYYKNYFDKRYHKLRNRGKSHSEAIDKLNKEVDRNQKSMKVIVPVGTALNAYNSLRLKNTTSKVVGLLGGTAFYGGMYCLNKKLTQIWKQYIRNLDEKYKDKK